MFVSVFVLLSDTQDLFINDKVASSGPIGEDDKSTETDEQTLIRQAQSGDLESFNQPMLHHQDGLYRYATALSDDSDLAADLTQESFVKAFQNIKALQSVAFRPWLFKIATNTARDIARRNASHPLIQLYPKDENGEEVESPDWFIDSNASVEDIVQANESSSRLYQLLSELPEVYRSILTLIDLQEMDYTETAEILNVPLGTVKSRLARARMQMKVKLSGSHRDYTTSNRSHALAI